jgi:RNA polymerase-binding transcription factor DksA
MNLTALTLLQGRLYDIALESDANLRRLREGPDALCPAGSDESQWDDAARRSRSALLEFWQRRLSMALRALERIEKGLFGSCDICGQEIDRVHLFVRLDRLTCPDCDRLWRAPPAAVPTFEPDSDFRRA